MMESCGFVTPSGIVGSSNSTGIPTITAMEPGLFRDMYGSTKFSSSSVSSNFDDGGGTGSDLWDLGIFAMWLEELGGFALNQCTMTKTWAPAGCTSVWEAVSCVR